ncbi:MAG: hypothetical protein WDA16_13690 [Candidatus Thermoplasmatota archaeon]
MRAVVIAVIALATLIPAAWGTQEMPIVASGVGGDAIWFAVRVPVGTTHLIATTTADTYAYGNEFADAFYWFDENDSWSGSILGFTTGLEARAWSRGDPFPTSVTTPPSLYTPGGSGFEVGCAECPPTQHGFTVLHAIAGGNGSWSFTVRSADGNSPATAYGDRVWPVKASDFSGGLNVGAKAISEGLAPHATHGATWSRTMANHPLGVFAVGNTAPLSAASASGPDGRTPCPCQWNELKEGSAAPAGEYMLHLDDVGSSEPFALIIDARLP